MADLPVAALRLQEQTDILKELGIERIGQILALPREELAARFDRELLLRLDQAVGLVPEPIVSHRPPPDIIAETELEFPTDNRQALDIILGQLMERVVQTLVARQQGVIQLECQLRCEATEPTEFVVGLFRAAPALNICSN